MRLILALLFFTLPCFAQEAKVIPIEPADAEKAKHLYERMQQAKKDWEDFNLSTNVKYLTVPYDSPERGNSPYYTPAVSGHLYDNVTSGISCLSASGRPEECSDKHEKQREEERKKIRWKRSGWEDAKFEFSKDFKFIVPKSDAVSATKLWQQGPCFGVTPASI